MLAVIFAIFIILALGFMGNMVQSNSIGAAFSGVFESRNINIPPVAIGILLAVIAAFIFVGGTTRLAAVVERIVPFMAGIYIVGSLILIGMNITALPWARSNDFRRSLQSDRSGRRRSRYHGAGSHPLWRSPWTFLQ